MEFEGFRGHDFKVFAENVDRNLNQVLGVVSPTCTHSGPLLDIINNVFGVRDTSVDIRGLIPPPSGLYPPFIMQVRGSGYEAKGRIWGGAGLYPPSVYRFG